MIMQCDAMSTAMEEESGFELQNHMGFVWAGQHRRFICLGFCADGGLSCGGCC